MAQFSSKFFESETRDGFYIEELMKKAWAAQVEMIEVLDAVCKRHNLKYYADGGTLL